jgi:flagellar protein FlaG
MEGITQIIKVPEAVSREAARARPKNPQAPAAAAVLAGPQTPAAVQPVQPAEVKQAAVELEKALQQHNSDLSVSVDETTGTMVVRITDNSTGELVKQIPPEELMEANASMNKIVGLLIDDQG